MAPTPAQAPVDRVRRTLARLGMPLGDDPVRERPVESRAASLARFCSALVDVDGGGTVLLDGETILDASAGFARLLGTDVASLVGHHVRRFLANRLFNGFLSTGFGLRDAGQPFEVAALRADGAPFLAGAKVDLLHVSAVNRIYALRLWAKSTGRSARSRVEQAIAGRPQLLELTMARSETLWAQRDTFPMWQSMELEIQSNCNRDCVWCPRFGDRSGVRKTASGATVKVEMPTAQVHRLIDEAADLGFRGLFKLHRLSDPFLDKRYLEFARHAKERGFFLQEDTNGDVLARDAALLAAVDGLLDVVRIGLYDCTTADEINDAVRLWRGRFRRTLVLFSVPQWFCTLREGAADEARPGALLDPVYLDYPCHQPYAYLMIRYDGRIGLCCADDDGGFDLGDAFESSLQSIWWSERHMALARTLVQPGGRVKAGGRCATCYQDTAQAHLMATT